MSVQELSAQIGISLPKAYELVKRPGFPSLRVGTRILVPVDAFRDWLARAACQANSSTSTGEETAWKH